MLQNIYSIVFLSLMRPVLERLSFVIGSSPLVNNSPVETLVLKIERKPLTATGDQVFLVHRVSETRSTCLYPQGILLHSAQFSLNRVGV